jgi:hypothetical protein
MGTPVALAEIEDELWATPEFQGKTATTETGRLNSDPADVRHAPEGLVRQTQG